MAEKIHFEVKVSIKDNNFSDEFFTGFLLSFDL